MKSWYQGHRFRGQIYRAANLRNFVAPLQNLVALLRNHPPSSKRKSIGIEKKVNNTPHLIVLYFVLLPKHKATNE